MFGTAVVFEIGVYSPYRLFSQTNITGSFITEAMLSDSWKAPILAAPSPKKVIATWFVPLYHEESAAPTATGSPAPTIANEPRAPTFLSAICIEPPFPWQQPVDLPRISAIKAFGSIPFARQCPCPLYVQVIQSSFEMLAIAPTETASCP